MQSQYETYLSNKTNKWGRY